MASHIGAMNTNKAKSEGYWTAQLGGSITVDRAGKRYHGEWRVEHGMLQVSCPELGFKETQARGGPAGSFEGLARVLLFELVTEHWTRRSGASTA